MYVVFACPHGAGKSRVAAAWFRALGPSGWQAESVASADPEPAVGPDAVRLLAGTSAEPFLDRSAPRRISPTPQADRVIAIDGDVPGASSWRLGSSWPSSEAVVELRERVEALVAELGKGEGDA